MNSSFGKLLKQIPLLFVVSLCAGGVVSCTDNGKKAESKAIAPLAKENKGEKTVVLKTQTMCPVMKGQINKSLYVDAKGYRIYVCCSGCIDEIKKDPDKYIKILHETGVEIEKAP